MGAVVTAYLAELKEEEDQGLVIVACVVTSARRHITKEKKLMVFAQVEDVTGSVEATIFPRTYEATAAVWNNDEILLVLGRVEKRDEAPKILVEHAVPFNDQGIRDIKRVAAETAERLAKRARFIRPSNGGPYAGPASGGPSPRPRVLTRRGPSGAPADVVQAERFDRCGRSRRTRGGPRRGRGAAAPALSALSLPRWHHASPHLPYSSRCPSASCRPTNASSRS